MIDRGSGAELGLYALNVTSHLPILHIAITNNYHTYIALPVKKKGHIKLSIRHFDIWLP